MTRILSSEIAFFHGEVGFTSAEVQAEVDAVLRDVRESRRQDIGSLTVRLMVTDTLAVKKGLEGSSLRDNQSATSVLTQMIEKELVN